MKKENLIKKFLPYYKPYKKMFFIDLLCALILALSGLVFPILVRYLLNNVLVENNIVVSALIMVLALMISFKIIEVVCKYFVTTIGHRMGVYIEADIRRELFDRLMKMSHSFYDEHKIGDLMSRITNDLFQITEFSHHCPEEFFIAIVKFLGIFIYLSTINFLLTLILFISVPLVLIFAYIYNLKLGKAFSASRKKVGEINTQIEDSLSGIRVVKSFANEDLEMKKFEKGNDDFVAIKSKTYKIMGVFFSGISFFSGLLYIIIVAVGSLFIWKKLINTVDLIAYLLYINTLLQTIESIVQFTEQFQNGLTGFQRFSAIMEEKVEITDGVNSKDVQKLEGEIELKNVNFSYSDDGKKILKDINLKIKKGENVAIVGKSGGGKTTLVNLIPRFYDATFGEILIDGISVKEITLKSLRENIGVVQQDVYLFGGTIKENIKYGLENATDSEIENSAKLSGSYDFIMATKNGFDTYVGERGVKLSGGQKQRISIARLFLKNPPILILDEATSSLDNESEKLVQKSLEVLAKGRTTITIAHRLSTIKNADRIIVLGDLGIIEEGNHKELVEKGGAYSKLYSQYEI